MSDAVKTWFIKIGEDVFGPYPSERVRAFVSEGRLRSHSLISRRRDGGFGPIERVPDLMERPAPIRREAEGAPPPRPAPPRPSVEPVTTAPSNFVVIAQFDVTDATRLTERLRDFGPIEPIGPNAWALRAATTVEALRNALTRGLTARETLFIVDASRDKAAWFNLGSERDARLRALREDPEPGSRSDR